MRLHCIADRRTELARTLGHGRLGGLDIARGDDDEIL
jgi:hypothetical protein